MAAENHHSPGLAALVGRLARTGVGALRNRLELLAVEWQQEQVRLLDLLLMSAAVIFFAIMGLLLLTATIIFLVPADLRVYCAAGFAVVYLLAALIAWFGLKTLLRHEPFCESINQVKKDRVWLESLD